MENYTVKMGFMDGIGLVVAKFIDSPVGFNTESIFTLEDPFLLEKVMVSETSFSYFPAPLILTKEKNRRYNVHANKFTVIPFDATPEILNIYNQLTGSIIQPPATKLIV
jgi:hypothetical protein